MFDSGTVDRVLGEWASADYDTWPIASLNEQVLDLGRLRDRLDAAFVCALSAAVERAGWALDGAVSPVSWLAHRTGMARNDAAALVKMARLVAGTPRLLEVLADGSLPVAKLWLLALVAIPARRRLWDRDADMLIDVALSLDLDDLKIATRRWASLADDELDRGEPDDLYRRRRLSTRTHDGRGELHAYGPAADIAALEEMLDRREPPDSTDGPAPARTVAQRRYDALADLAGDGLAGTDGRVNPDRTINVMVDYDTLLRLLGGAQLPAAEPPSADTLTRWRQHLLNGDASLPDAALERLLCTSWISRVVFGPDGEILDLGRRARLFTPAQQRAIRARDGGCAFPGCDRPPQWCDIHHLEHWEHGGETDVGNGVCLCRRHHSLVHEGGWRLWRERDGTWHAVPPDQACGRPTGLALAA